MKIWKPCLLDDDEPSPLSQRHVLPEVPLGNLDQFPLVSLLLENSEPDPLEDLALDLPDPLDHELVPQLLQEGECPCPEEDQGMSKPVSFPSKTDLVHQRIRRRLVVR